MDDLVERCRSLARCEHSDLSIGDEAADAIEALQRQLGEARDWLPIESAPKDGTVLLLFARCKTATASAPVLGWFHPGHGWVESAFVPNRAIGIVPSHWMHRPAFPTWSRP